MCIDLDDANEMIAEAHVTIGGFHASKDKIECRIRCNGFWWPSIARDVARYIQHCPTCIENQGLNIYVITLNFFVITLRYLTLTTIKSQTF